MNLQNTKKLKYCSIKMSFNLDISVQKRNQAYIICEINILRYP